MITRRPLLVTAVIAIAAAESGTAILTATKDERSRIDVIAIDRLKAGLGPASAWLRKAVPDLRLPPQSAVIIDVDGVGEALYTHLVGRRQVGWTLYPKRGRERQELVNALLIAQQEGRIRIGRTGNDDAMRRALAGYKRVVGDDGVVGAELVIALALTTIVRPPGEARVW